MPLLSRAAKKKTSWLRRKIYSWNPGKNCQSFSGTEGDWGSIFGRWFGFGFGSGVFQGCDLAGSHLELPEAFVSTDLKFYVKVAYPALERS